jgi:MFS family permease
LARQHRFTVLGLLFAAWLLCYVDRMVMASAIPFIGKEFGLSALQMGAVMSAFFVGYALMQLPGGLLADRFGTRHIIVLALLSWSIFTACTGLATSFGMLLAIRVLFGIGEGAFPAAASKTILTHFSDRDVGRANGVMLMAVQLGALLAPSLVAILVITWGWRAAFYVLLLPGALLALIVWRLLADVGTVHRHSSASSTSTTRVLELLRNPAVRWCFATAFFSNLAMWGLMNWLPTYLLQARGFSVIQMGTLMPILFVGGALGYFFGGQVADRYFRDSRRVPVLCGLLLAAGFTFLAASADNGHTTIGYLTAAFLCLSAADSSIFTLPLVIVPEGAAASAFGFVNTAAQCAGFLSPLLAGYILDASGNNFTLLLYCFVGALAASAAMAARIRQLPDATPPCAHADSLLNSTAASASQSARKRR